MSATGNGSLGGYQTVNTKKAPSWALIIITFIFFWPIGVILLIKRIKNDKTAVLLYGNIITILGCLFCVTAAILVVSLFSGGYDSNTMQTYKEMAVFFTVFSLVLIIVGISMKKKGYKVRKIINMTVNQNMTSIDDIAAEFNKTYEQTVADMQKMMNDGYFGNAQIDNVNHRFVVSSESHTVNNIPVNNIPVQNASQTDAVERVVVCKCCGARNSVTGNAPCECEYCGSPLN